MPGPVDHYRTLGVPSDATPEVLRDAYRNLARRNHPDRVDDPTQRALAAERMAAVNEAWQVLGDPERRATYDLVRRAGPRSTPMADPPDDPADNRVYGRRGDAFDDVAVSPAAGCVLRVVPVVVTLVVLLGILIATAILGGGGEVPARMEAGRCVEVATTIRVVPCMADTPVIVGRGVAGTPCPTTAVAVVQPSRTEQLCVAPPGTPVP